jgi:hypothetical protein
MRENVAHPRRSSAKKRRASTKHATTRQTKPMPPDTEVQHAVPTGGGGSLRRAMREALRRVRPEDSAGDHAHPIDRQQPGSPCATYTLVEDAAQPDGARDDHQACHYQVGDLDPAKAAVGEHAPRVPGQVEPVPGQRLGQRHRDIERARATPYPSRLFVTRVAGSQAGALVVAAVIV